MHQRVLIEATHARCAVFVRIGRISLRQHGQVACLCSLDGPKLIVSRGPHFAAARVGGLIIADPFGGDSGDRGAFRY